MADHKAPSAHKVASRKASSGEHDRKQNVSGWQKHASDLVQAVLVAVVMETEVGGRAVTVPLVDLMSVWHVGRL